MRLNSTYLLRLDKSVSKALAVFGSVSMSGYFNLPMGFCERIRVYACASFLPYVCLSLCKSVSHQSGSLQSLNMRIKVTHFSPTRINMQHYTEDKKDTCMSSIICETTLHFLLYKKGLGYSTFFLTK